ncbi:hypothetical protein [Zavarzinia sp.]|uniref:hypothetical protein n=1 Tax=Zavarzinia sp. TaxID=2027920 RepID=UPI003569B33D
MRRWRWIALAIVVLALIGAGGLYLGGFLPFGGATDEAAAAPPPTLPQVEERTYFELKNVILPAVRNGKLRNYIAFTFKIEVKDLEASNRLKEREPHIRAALVALFSSDPIQTGDGPADFDEIPFREKALAAIRKAAGDIEITGMLVSSILPIKS